jgi:NADPH:quinone reductase-like Zn-dependent oxidoreductase
VLIAIQSASVGWVDLLMTSGQYQHMPHPPYTPGLEYSGLVAAVGAAVDPASVAEHRVLSAPDGTVLIFGRAALSSAAALPAFSPTTETSELLILHAPQELAFSLHAQVLCEFFARRGG